MALPQKLTWKPKTKAQRGPEWKPRRCKHCKLMYVPADKNPANAQRSKFCCKKCKDGFHRHGGLNLARFQELVGKRVFQQLRADQNFIQALADKLRVTSAVGIVPHFTTPYASTENHIAK